MPHKKKQKKTRKQEWEEDTTAKAVGEGWGL